MMHSQIGRQFEEIKQEKNHESPVTLICKSLMNGSNRFLKHFFDEIKLKSLNPCSHLHRARWVEFDVGGCATALANALSAQPNGIVFAHEN